MSQPGTFDRVYAALKERLRLGHYRPGEKLEPATLSAELNASVTPVRDALHRLTGERLVDAPRHEGFRAPVLTEAMLRHLYGWHLDILTVAVARRKAELGGEQAFGEGQFERLEHAFAGLAAASGNPEHAAALRAVTERLEPYQRVEWKFLDAVERETEEILSAIRIRDRKALRSSLLRYHRRRQRIVPQLLFELTRDG